MVYRVHTHGAHAPPHTLIFSQILFISQAYTHIQHTRHTHRHTRTRIHTQVHHVLEVLNSCSHNGFPVININGEGGGGRNIMGVVLRQHLLVLLSSQRCFQASPNVVEVSGRCWACFCLSMCRFGGLFYKEGSRLFCSAYIYVMYD